MAIHWKQIKGLADSSDTLYTYLIFQTTAIPCNLYTKTTNTDSISGNGITDLGLLATTKYSNFFELFCGFESGIQVGGTNFNVGTLGSYTITDSYNEFWTNATGYRFKATIDNFDDFFVWLRPAETKIASSVISLLGTTNIGIASDNKNLTVYGNATISGSCDADYFNATSDARAKDHIKPFEFNALDFISSLNLYSFHYKHDDSPSIGIIAQEVKDIKIDDFSLVNNIEATGKDNDFMSIKESKIVYILLKAVKELQAEVNELKFRLGE